MRVVLLVLLVGLAEAVPVSETQVCALYLQYSGVC
jgi:hypothetical protein